MPYPGGKAGPGVVQRLINEIPPHQNYIAAYAGHDAIARFKRPAATTILVDADPKPLAWWSEYLADLPADPGSRYELHHADAVQFLIGRFGLSCLNHQPAFDADTFVYLDPPYLMSTRTSGKIYDHEMTVEQHVAMLDIANRLPCNVMISGYASPLYAEHLAEWRTFTYEASVRSGARRTETCWCNFAPPTQLHDSRYVGGDKRHRENVRRRINRLTANLAALSNHERQSVLDALRNLPLHSQAIAAERD